MKRLLSLALLVVLASCGSSTADATSGYLGLYATAGVSLISTSATMSTTSGTSTTSTTSGTAPLYVFFDASGTTDGDSTACPSCDPFRDLQYTWNFGDTGAAWTNGVRTGAGSANTAYGPIAAHVYANAGTYNVTVTITDGTNTVSSYAVGTVTVADPNTTFSGTNTTCYSPTGNFTNCPSGATQTTSGAFISGAVSGSHRYLYHCGETFTSGASATITGTGPIRVGTYDCGTNPTATVNATAASMSFFGGSSSGTWRDFAVSGFVFSNNGNSGVGFISGINGAAVVSNVLAYNNTLNTMSPAVSMDVSSQAYYVAAVANTINSTPNESFYGFYYGDAAMGNYWNGTGSSGTYVNVIRTMGAQKQIISNNKFRSFGNDGKSTAGTWITVRVHDASATDPQAGYGLISENDAQGGGNATMGVSANAYTYAEHNTEVIVERNFITLDTPTAYTPGTPITMDCNTCDVRDNIINATGVVGNTEAIDLVPIDQHSGAWSGGPTNVRVLNNTIYNGATQSFQCIALDTLVTNATVKNNACYSPTGTTPYTIITSGTVTGTVESNNTCGSGAVTSCAGTLTTSPSWSNGSGTYSLNTDFKPSAGYTIGAGTSVPVWSDFFAVTQPSPRDMGAVNH